ncbi:SEFIR domain-containing protein [Mycobacterium seoulense]|uniref:SEFIR domain-containing protein n=1 Tax=Mycobacterium seoulense TaxID=386911 RepID=UPI003CE7B77D
MTEPEANTGAETHPTCFISYSHDSEAHKQAVVDLAQALRRNGIDVMLDRFVEHSPPQWWPQWMFRQIRYSDFVIVVVTEIYARRFLMEEEQGVGLGATWEGAVINNHIYQGYGGTVKFIPVVFDPSDRPLIPFPLSETNSYTVRNPDDEQFRLLLHQLNNIPTIVPEPLGPAGAVPPKNSTDLEAALQLMASNKDAAAEELEQLCNSSEANTAATAAFYLGEIRYDERLLTKAIKAYQFALEFGPRTPIFEQAQQNLLAAVAEMQAQYAEGSARAAVYLFLSLIKSGDILEAWKGLDHNIRLALAQWWILGNEDHPNLVDRDKDELAAALSSVAPAHPLAEPFLRSQLVRFQDAYAEVDPTHWGAAEKRRFYKMDYEIVILMPTYGEETMWEPGMARPTATFVMRRGLGRWLVAGFNSEIPRPGWPPTSESIPTAGITFGSGEPPTATTEE